MVDIFTSKALYRGNTVHSLWLFGSTKNQLSPPLLVELSLSSWNMVHLLVTKHQSRKNTERMIRNVWSVEEENFFSSNLRTTWVKLLFFFFNNYPLYKIHVWHRKQTTLKSVNFQLCCHSAINTHCDVTVKQAHLCDVRYEHTITKLWYGNGTKTSNCDLTVK